MNDFLYFFQTVEITTARYSHKTIEGEKQPPVPLFPHRFPQRFSFYFQRRSCHRGSCATGTNLLVKLSILSENIPTTCPSANVLNYTHARSTDTMAIGTAHVVTPGGSCSRPTEVTRYSVKYRLLRGPRSRSM